MDLESLKQRMTTWVGQLQEEICRALERVDGRARFREDRWQRPGGGGGKTRILEGGEVFEKAGVNTSAVFGELEEAFAKRLHGEGRTFFASGISLVLHPQNPWVPTVHANYRFIIQGAKAWFGGGADLTPYYLVEEDVRHFHCALKAACDRHGEGLYARFKRSCDEYFFLPHRGEARGVGGLFFENLGGELESEFALVKELGHSFLPAYLPLVEKRAAQPFTEAQRKWQEVRRGRYVEFNLLYDRGTVFGLETKGRTESILMSLPPRVQWVYDFQPESGTDEAKLLDVLRRPRGWT